MKNLKNSIKTIAITVLALVAVSCEKEKQLPGVTTQDISDVTTTTAVLKSVITSDGGATITARGVCWSTSPNANVENSKTVDSVLSGESKSKMSNLANNVVYYARAYATNSVGTVYGNEISFTTKNVPTLNTLSVSDIQVTSCKISAPVISSNCLPIIKKGVVYNNGTDMLTAYDTSAKEGVAVILVNLQVNSKYTVKAFVTNESGTFYSEESTFTTKNIPVLGKVSISTISSISCKVSVPVSEDNILPITKKGVLYNDGTTDFTVLDETPGAAISVTLADLFPGTDYTIKAFVTNASGTYYSAVEMFSTCPFNPGGGGGDTGPFLKPNIYLYPTAATNLTVTLGFPKGGHVTTSIPEYGTGWEVHVAPSGMIDNKYGYLFYESVQPDVCQTAAAWCIKKADLKDFFIKNMTEYGFKGQEITDFVDFWVPRLTAFEYYIIYPQDTKILNTAVTINISKTPDQVLRLFYLISGSQTVPSKTFVEPQIDRSFSRTGFFVTEWGVVLR